MSFLLTCPHCGPRDVYEFRYGGEASRRPGLQATRDDWVRYLYFRANTAGPQKEWWYHRMGCQSWFLAERDVSTNRVLATSTPGGST